MMLKINKNIIIGISIAVVLVFSIIIGSTLFQKGKIPSEKEIIPEKEETREEVLERLTPAEPESLTEEEKKEQEELLKQLTPSQPKAKTPEEQREEEELLKRLTP